MSANYSFAARTGVNRGVGHNGPARFFTLALLPLIVAFAVIPAVACALLFSALFGGSNAHAFSSTQFQVTPSTTQSAAHPNVNFKIGRGGSDSEDIKTVVVKLPAGLLANPNAPTSKCSSTYFNIDFCSANSYVGKIETSVTAMGLLPMDVNGSIYVLTPNSTDAATLGYKLRPIGSAISLIKKIGLKNNVTVDPSNYKLVNTHLNLPTTAGAVAGLIPVPITIEMMNLTFNAKTNTAQTGKYFMLNPSDCGPQTSDLTMTSWQNVTVTNTSTFNLTGCGTVPFNPGFAETFTVLNAEKYTGTTVTVTQDRLDAAQQQSTIEAVQLTYPQGTALNFPVINALTGCTNAQFLANSCPAASKIGTTAATVPVLGAFSGGVYALDPIGSTLNFGAYLAGPRGTKAYVYGSASVVGVGPTQRVVANVTNSPPFPISKFTLTFSSLLLQQPENCGSQTVNADIKADSGQTVNRTMSYSTANCAPSTTITSAPASPSNDTTPSFSFTATPPTGATFQCALDSGAFSACTSGAALAALADGDYLFRVRACNSIGNCDHTPAEYNLTIDTVAPPLTISAPATGSTVETANVSVVFDTENGATATCSLDGGTPVVCAEPSYTFTGVADGGHSITVVATDAAGNSSSASTSFTVDTNVVAGVNTQIDDGPRGGLAITDQTPTFDFSSDPAGAPAFECSIDAGAWTACASPTTVDPLEIGPHTLSVRAIGDLGDIPGSTDPTPAVASFEVSSFTPDATFEYLDNTNNAIPNTQAAQHPDVNVAFTNPAGDPDSVSFQLPDGFWGSLGSVPQCSLADVSSGSCGATNKIGTLELTAVTNANVSHTFSSDVYMTESPGDALAGLAANVHIAFDGKDYGYLRDDALFNFEARYVRDDPDTANVHDPRGVNGTAPSLPNNTDAHPGPDGSTTMHVRELKVHLDGETGAGIGKPLLTAPSSCDPLEAKAQFTDKEANPAEITVPYQATDCATVGFAPTLTQGYAPVTKGGNTTVSADASVPDQHSSIRNLVLDLPVSVQPQYAGLGLSCLPSDTALIPPACSATNHLVGSASIDTPLLATPITGEVYLEDSGNPLPNIYLYVHDDALGLDFRLRGAVETLGTPSHLRFKINAEADGSLTDITDVPVSSLSMSLPGSIGQGPILKVSTVCRKTDATSAGAFTGWTGATASVTQTISFDPTCPN